MRKPFCQKTSRSNGPPLWTKLLLAPGRAARCVLLPFMSLDATPGTPPPTRSTLLHQGFACVFIPTKGGLPTKPLPPSHGHPLPLRSNRPKTWVCQTFFSGWEILCVAPLLHVKGCCFADVPVHVSALIGHVFWLPGPRSRPNVNTYLMRYFMFGIKIDSPDPLTLNHYLTSIWFCLMPRTQEEIQIPAPLPSVTHSDEVGDGDSNSGESDSD